MLAEIQQTSDITYRVYDWDRVDDNGTSRELHTDLALDAIEYKSQASYKTDYNTVKNESSTIVDCQYFTTSVLVIDKPVSVDNSKKDSFVIYMCVEGEVTIICDTDKKESLSKGETVLIPADLNKFEIRSNGHSELLEVFIKS